MRGADPINDELEVGFNEPFERRWHIAEQVGRGVMVLFVAAALAGLLGRGPFSHRTVKGDGFSVDFEPVARVQTPTQVTFNLSNPTGQPTVALFIGTKLIEPLGMQRILPQPLATRVVAGGLDMVFAVPPGETDAKVRVTGQPTGIGPVGLEAAVAGHAPVRWTQFVLP